MIRAALVTLTLVASVSVAGCGGDTKTDYCDAVKGNQKELSGVLGDGGPDALLNALPIFRDLSEKAPQDIRDDWQQVVRVLDRLQKALDAAGVDAATYDRDHPPAGLSASDKDSIDAAAAELTTPQTQSALTGVDQQARDVCGTPLLV